MSPSLPYSEILLTFYSIFQTNWLANHFENDLSKLYIYPILVTIFNSRGALSTYLMVTLEKYSKTRAYLFLLRPVILVNSLLIIFGLIFLFKLTFQESIIQLSSLLITFLVGGFLQAVFYSVYESSLIYISNSVTPLQKSLFCSIFRDLTTLRLILVYFTYFKISYKIAVLFCIFFISYVLLFCEKAFVLSRKNFVPILISSLIGVIQSYIYKFRSPFSSLLFGLNSITGIVVYDHMIEGFRDNQKFPLFFLKESENSKIIFFLSFLFSIWNSFLHTFSIKIGAILFLVRQIAHLLAIFSNFILAKILLSASKQEESLENLFKWGSVFSALTDFMTATTLFMLAYSSSRL